MLVHCKKKGIDRNPEKGNLSKVQSLVKKKKKMLSILSYFYWLLPSCNNVILFFHL